MSRTTDCTISSLPPELLGLIITHASFDDPSAPLRLAGVSPTFHRVAMSTPGAWTKLSLRVTSASESQMMGSEVVPWAAVQKAEMWFQRSGACSVDIEVELLEVKSLSSAPRRGKAGNYFGGETEEERVGKEEWGILLLPRVLSRFRHRIRSLVLHTTTPADAQAFFDVVYPSAPSEVGPHDLPLEALTLIAASDGASGTHLERVPTLKVRPPSTSIGDALCRNIFARLEHLTFVNHPLPFSSASSFSPAEESGSSSSEPLPPLPRLLGFNTGHHLRSLCVTYPLRFAPIPLSGLLDALRATPGLERLQVEGRVSLGDISHHHHQGHGVAPAQGHRDAPSVPASPSDQLSMATSSFTTAHGASVATPSSVATTLSFVPSNVRPLASSQSHSRPLLALPSLATLALKANNLPSILSSLILPALRELRIEDMDAKRRGAARETAEALRGLMVRGEMPLGGLHGIGEDDRNGKRLSDGEGRKTAKGGLEVLDMCNIALCHPISAVLPLGSEVPVYHSSTHAEARHSAARSQSPDANEDDGAAALWRWCFRRMCHLRELRVAKMDVDSLLGYITPSLPSAPSSCFSQSSLRRPSTLDDRRHSRQDEMYSHGGDMGRETCKKNSAGVKAMSEQETQMEAQAEVDADLLPRLKRLVLADSRPALNGIPGAAFSVPPLARDVWGVGHASSSASMCMFKIRRQDVVVENVSWQSGAGGSSAPLKSLSSTVPHTPGLHGSRVDYFSLYL